MPHVKLAWVDSPRWSLITFGVLLLPVLLTIWTLPWFVTQDGPSHLYNAYIMSELLKGNSPVQDVYVAHWWPLPNIIGHWLLVALLQIVPARTADRVLMTLTSAGLASAVLWLRWRVAGWNGMALLAPLAVALALNILWLCGFYNFLLGVCLFAVTLGYWWASRDHLGWRRAAIVAALVVLGYLCHLVSSVLTIFGLLILGLTTPAPGWLTRCRWTALSLTPLVPSIKARSGALACVGRCGGIRGGGGSPIGYRVGVCVDLHPCGEPLHRGPAVHRDRQADWHTAASDALAMLF